MKRKKVTAKKVAVVKAAPSLTAQQKKDHKAQIATAVHDAYLKGRADEARDQEKIAAAREKAIDAATAKFVNIPNTPMYFHSLRLSIACNMNGVE